MSDDAARYFDEISQLYGDAFREYGDDPRSLFTPKGRHFLRYARLLKDLAFESLLDVGCGTGLLRAYLNAHGLSGVRYTGIDIVEPMVELCRRKFPADRFVHVTNAGAIGGRFDAILVSGTFNRIPDAFTYEQHRAFVFDTLESLFARADRYLVFDFMNDLVDFTSGRDFHLAHADAVAFVVGRLSRRFELIQSYMPYEAAMRVFKDTAIDRSANVFADGREPGPGGG